MSKKSLQSNLSLKKKIVFYIIMVVLMVGLTETFAHILYRAWEGYFIWNAASTGYTKVEEVFSVRDFIQRVDDERYFTTKKNYAYYHPPTNTSLTIDKHGFRGGTHTYSPDKKSIVFLGDSVPFGWHLNDEQTIPSKFHQLLTQNNPELAYGVINAAVPSYTLEQAVQRYKYDVHDQFLVKHVFLQIYGPVHQFEKFGREWHKGLNWYTETLLEGAPNPILKYSAIYGLIYKNIQNYNNQRYWLDLEDEAAFKNFEVQNISSLDELRSFLEEDEANLILLPVNVPRHAGNSDTRKAAISKLNEILENYAEAHHNVYFFDVRANLSAYVSKELFIDNCCHLSELGTALQADFLIEQLIVHQLLSDPQPHSQTQTWPILENLRKAAEHIATQAQPGEVVIGISSTKPLQQYIQPPRQDLFYIDRDTTTLPHHLSGRWYFFYGAKNIPESWLQTEGVQHFGNMVLVHQSQPCQIADCLAETSLLLTEMAQANPDSILARKIFYMLANMKNLLVQ